MDAIIKYFTFLGALCSCAPVLNNDAAYFETGFSNITVSKKDPKLEEESFDVYFRDRPYLERKTDMPTHSKDITSEMYRLWDSNGGRFPDWLYQIIRDDRGRDALDTVSRAYSRSKMISGRPEPLDSWLLNDNNNLSSPKRHFSTDIDNVFEFGSTKIRPKETLILNPFLPNKHELAPKLKYAETEINPLHESNATDILYRMWQHNEGHFPVWVYNVCHDQKSKRVLQNLDNLFRNRTNDTFSTEQESINTFYSPNSSRINYFNSTLSQNNLRKDPYNYPYRLRKEQKGLGDGSSSFRNIKTLKSIRDNPMYSRIFALHRTTTDSYEHRQIKDFLAVIKQITEMGLTLEEMDRLSKNPKDKEIYSSLDERDSILKEINSFDRIQEADSSIHGIDINSALSQLSSLVSKSTDDNTRSILKSIFDNVRNINEEKYNQNISPFKYMS